MKKIIIVLAMLIPATCFAQVTPYLPKQDDRLKKAISTDDNVEGGGLLVLDANDNIQLVKGTVIGKRKNSLYNNLNIQNEPEVLDI
jgi:hypothetical protein